MKKVCKAIEQIDKARDRANQKREASKKPKVKTIKTIAAVAAVILATITSTMAQQQYRGLGQFVLGTIYNAPTNPPGYTVYNFKITGTADDKSAIGRIGFKFPPPEIPLLGYVPLFTGHDGNSWWSNTGDNSPAQQKLGQNITPADMAAYLDGLVSAGYAVIQIQWLSNGWITSPLGVALGFKTLAIQPATVLKWNRDTYATGDLKLKAAGVSGGSYQLAAALIVYGLGSIQPPAVKPVVDEAYIVSGPPYTHLREGCLQANGWQFSSSAAVLMNLPDGIRGPSGPCTQHDVSWSQFWDADSLESEPPENFGMATQMYFLQGKRDNPNEIKSRQNDLMARMDAQGSSTFMMIANTMGHPLNKEGANLLFNALATPPQTP